MKRLIGGLLIFAVVLSGCVTLGPKATPLQRVTILCAGYASTLNALATLKTLKKLTPDQIATVDAARPGLNALCLGPPPTEITAREAIDLAEQTLLTLILMKEGAQK